MSANPHVVLIRERQKQLRRRSQHIQTHIEVKGQVKIICSCGGQSKKGSLKVRHEHVM